MNTYKKMKSCLQYLENKKALQDATSSGEFRATSSNERVTGTSSPTGTLRQGHCAAGCPVLLPFSLGSCWLLLEGEQWRPSAGLGRVSPIGAFLSQLNQLQSVLASSALLSGACLWRTHIHFPGKLRVTCELTLALTYLMLVHLKFCLIDLSKCSKSDTSMRVLI